MRGYGCRLCLSPMSHHYHHEVGIVTGQSVNRSLRVLGKACNCLKLLFFESSVASWGHPRCKMVQYRSTCQLKPQLIPKLERIHIFLDVDTFMVQVAGLRDTGLRKLIAANRPIVVASSSSKRRVGFNLPVIIEITILKDPVKQLLSVNYAARDLGIKRASEETREIDELEQEYGTSGLFIHYATEEDTAAVEIYMMKVMKALESYRMTLWNHDSIVVERAALDDIHIDATGLVHQRFFGGKNSKRYFALRLKTLTALTKAAANSCGESVAVATFEDDLEMFCDSALASKIAEWRIKQDHQRVQLLHGACIAMAMTRFIKNSTQLQVSAGVSHTKNLAKLACKRGKPEGVTTMAYAALPRLASEFKISQIYGYGGKAGRRLKELYSELYGDQLETFSDALRSDVDVTVRLARVLSKLRGEFDHLKDVDPELEAERVISQCHGNDAGNV